VGWFLHPAGLSCAVFPVTVMARMIVGISARGLSGQARGAKVGGRRLPA